MIASTQISGNIRPGNLALRALKTTLIYLGIKVTHPTSDESLFYETDTNAAWRHHDEELAFYKSIAKSSFHIIYNDAAIDKDIGLQILYAMSNGRPILMTGAPAFADDLTAFIRDLVITHLPQFHSVNLAELELVELSSLLRKLKATDYHLTNHEKVLIKSNVRSHFRELLDETRKLKVQKARAGLNPIEEI